MTITNPLLLQNPIENIDKIEAKHIEPAISEVLKDNLAAISSLIDDINSNKLPLDWTSFALPQDCLENKLSKLWSPISHLNSVCNNDELRKAYDGALAQLTEYSTQLGQNKPLFEITDRLYQAKDELNLTAPQIHILKDVLIGFKLSGLHLNDEDQNSYSIIQKRLAELSSKYEQNLMDATMAWEKLIDQSSALAGLPETEMAMLAASAKAKEQQGYLLTLEFPSYIAIMTYADDRRLREELYRAYSTRASDQSANADFDNSAIMAELLALKYQKAQLLGFDNYAELSLESKMAESPQQIMSFLLDLNQSAKKQAKIELQSLKAFAKENGVSDFQAWDAAYFSEKLQQQKFQISQTELRPYFQVNKVISGLFEITQHHFDVSFSIINDSATWHKDVIHYQINRNDKKIAEFYLDLYARPHKRGGAWMDDYQGRFKISDNQTQIPIAFLTCNFAPAVKDQPALLTHDEVVTLFHEFGHGLHHMLTQVDELSASGISNVPWDAVELPSQFMENFCYEPKVIKMLSEHFETGKNLPQEMLEKLVAAKNFQSAMAMVRQIEFSLFDMKIHSQPPLSSEQIQAVLDETRQEVAVITPPSFNRFQNSFSHIFAGGYSAGYYSYKWAEVLSADAFSLFEEQGVMNSDIGKKFLKAILEKGGTADPMTLFVDFRGRKPTVEALLRHSGISL